MATKAQEQAIRDYLTVLKDPSALRKGDVSDLEARVESTSDPVERLRLRSKIDDAYTRKLIHTIRGVGYVLEERH